MELLVAPQVHGETVYCAYIIAHKDSPFLRLEDLEGKTFAFTDPDSNTGKIVPTYMLNKIGKAPESFFKKFTYTYSHDNSIKAVADKVVDGASVDSLIYDYLELIHPEITAQTKVIAKSPPYGIPPIVVNPALRPQLKEGIRGILLNMHNDEKGRAILKGILIDRFVPVEDSLYDSAREMQAWPKEKDQ